MLRLIPRVHPTRYLSTSNRTNITNWYSSDILINKKSKFQARNVELIDSSQIDNILTQFLLQYKSISKNASHPHIIAWRTGEYLNDGTVININQGYRDNGEKGAGIKLLEDVLIKHNVINRLVIVTRWYGGNPIGSLRFRLINNAALQSLRSANKI